MRPTCSAAVIVIALAAFAPAWAVDLPKPGSNDPRIRHVDYRQDDIVLIKVRRGAVTRIIFSAEEAIESVGLGFPADCDKEGYEWCVDAKRGQSQIQIKPMDGATHNNMEVRTNLRDYSFEFLVLEDAPRGRWLPGGDGRIGSNALTDEPMARVIFTYPPAGPDRLPVHLLQPAAPVVTETDLIAERLAEKPIPRNWNYTSKIPREARSFAPRMVFDDGRHTCFEFPKNREVPAIFHVSPQGVEQRLNHYMTGDLACVHRLGAQFVLRQGQRVVGIWNESFDPDGVAAEGGVAVEGVHRELKPLSARPDEPARAGR